MSLSKKEEEIVFRLAEKLTGTCQSGSYRKDIFLTNVERRMHASGAPSLTDYLRLVRDDPREHEQLISGLTIHTTSWFREKPHFEAIAAYVREVLPEAAASGRAIKIWSAACSTGEEVFSVALSLMKESEQARIELHGSDLDPLSVRRAQGAVYDRRDIRDIPEAYRPHLLLGQKNVAGLFTFEKSLRGRCRFFVNDLNARQFDEADRDYDVILCRNVLIYFRPEDQRRIVVNLLEHLRPGGLLILGHSETPDLKGLMLEDQRASTYRKALKRARFKLAGEGLKPRLLIVDDSATIRQALEKMAESRFETVSCDSAENATKKIKEREFDLVSLDLNMPGENGLSWLARMRAEGLKTPVVILSESDPASAERLFGQGMANAQDYLTKSRLNQDAEGVLEIFRSLTAVGEKEEASSAEVCPFFASSFRPRLIAVGASTGGPEAIARLLVNFPKPCPPIVIVQHIAPEFCKAFGQRLSSHSGLTFAEFTGETELLRNHLYLTTRDVHLGVRAHGDGLVVFERDGGKELGHRPSVNHLFKSLARAGCDSIAVLLTGMGEDGADGMTDLAGAKRCYTMAQDRKSSVVYGMNRKAIEARAACFIASPEGLRTELIKRMKGWS